MKEVKTADAAEPRSTLVEAYAAQVIGDEARASELFRALPDHIPPERFQRNLINLLMQQPDVLKFDARLVYREVSTAAALGLLLDPQLGEAYVVPVWNGKLKRQEPQLRVGYRGIIKLARQSGDVSNIYAHEVHENDHVECDLGVDKRLVHKPNLFGERGKVIGYYAVVKYKDGTSDFEPMTLRQVHAIRARSDAWNAFQAGKIASTPWATDEDEMGKKTVIKRLLKRVPQSPDLAVALGMDEELAAESSNVISIRDARRRTKPRSIAARLDSFANDGEQANPAAPAVDEAGWDGLTGFVQPPTGQPPLQSPEEKPSVMPPKLLRAMARGRKAHRENRPRKLPKEFTAKKSAEAQAFLRGWDEEAFELRATDFGSL
jgi:recombination protein RecT